MSIKTSKRIALGVIAALVFAPFAAIAPASAAITAETGTLTVANATITTNSGTATSGSMTVGFTAGAANDAVTVTASLTKKANTSALTAANITIGDISAAANATGTGHGVTGQVATISATAGIAVSATHAVTITPDVPGTYEITLTPNGVGVTAGMTTKTITMTVLPSTSNTSTITATKDRAIYSAAATDAVITVSRNVGGLKTDGQILGRVDATANTTSSGAVGTVFGLTAAKEAGMTPSLSTNATVFTMDIDVIANVAAGVYATAGDYTFTFFNDVNSNGVLDAGEPTTSITITIGAAGAATSLISATLSRTIATTGANYNTITVTASITDADGNPTTDTLSLVETNVSGTATGTYTDLVDGGTTMTRIGTSNTFTASFTVDDVDAITAATTTYITVYSANIASTATTSAKKALTIVPMGDLTEVVGQDAVVVTDVVGIGSYTAGVRQDLSAATDTSAITLTVDRAVISHTYTFNAKAGDEGKYLKVAVAPAGTTSNTVVAPSFNLVRINEDLTGTLTVAVTAPAAADSYTLTWTDLSGDTEAATITFATAAPDWTVTPANFKAAFGDKVAVTGKLHDQFGRALDAKAVSVTVAGRNVGTYPGTTNASGEYKFEWTDASTSTVVLTDSLTFNYSYLATAASTTTTTKASAARVITYSATGPAVGSVVVTAPSLTTTRAIDIAQTAAGDPRSGSTVTYTVTVKTAAGVSVGSGVLVTFAGGSNDMFVGNAAQVTGTLGTASVAVYRQKAGSSAITATAGGVTSAAGPAVTWSNNLAVTADFTVAPVAATAAYNARYLALKADMATSVPEGIVRFIATVTDRFGNPVSGAGVTFSENGVGRFKNYTGTEVTTNAFGEVSVDMETAKLEIGSMSVSALLSDARSVQKNDIAGVVRVVADATNAAPPVAAATVVTAISGVTAAVKSATATATVANPVVVVPVVVVPPVAPTLTAERQGSRVLLFGSCMVDEGDMIIYVKSPGKAWSEKAKTLECAAGEYDGDIVASKTTKFYRVKQEGTGLWSTSKLVRP